MSVSVQLADHNIGRVTDDGTSNPRNIPTQETHPGLLQGVVALLWFPQRRVDVIDRRLKGREFHHCVWDLPAPKRVQTLVQSSDTLLCRHLAPSLPQRASEGRNRRLHPYLDRLQRTQRDVRQELCRRRRREIDDGFVGVREHLIAIGIFEDLVEPIFARTLERVADEGGGPAKENAADTLCFVNCAPGADVGRVDFGVDLAAAFDEIEGCDGLEYVSEILRLLVIMGYQPVWVGPQDIMPPRAQAPK